MLTNLQCAKVDALSCVRNMGNFNLFLTHVLMVFHHVEQ